MNINRSGPPKTHDRVTWRVPLSAPPSLRWQQSFRAAEESTNIATAEGVRFEDVALTFRSRDEYVPMWVEYIDKWIAHANATEAGVDDRRRRDTQQSSDQRDIRQKEVSEANEKFKNL
jgi:hypothetical protein